MAADVTSFGRDLNAAKTVIAHLIPNPGPRYQGWYVTRIEKDFPDEGHAAVDVRNKAEGKAFLEKWANEIAIPKLRQQQAELQKATHGKLAKAPKSREDKAIEKAREAEKHQRERAKDKDHGR